MVTRVSTLSGPTPDAEHTEEAKATEVNFSVENKFKSSFYCFSALHVQPVTTAVTFLFLPRADTTVSLSGKGIGKGQGKNTARPCLHPSRGVSDIHSLLASSFKFRAGKKAQCVKVLVQRPDTLGLIPGTVAGENKLYMSADNHAHCGTSAPPRHHT